jgi:hypothetical protein
MTPRFLAIAALLLLGGCTSCGLNGGWERAFNPFCVESKHAPAQPVPAGP